ncbi:MAG TPA: hypothetical protein VGO91_02320 [Pyrinomonadaceae bacterium]|nr:hypothetical protein [Pyrinomonadaceae bacterium]
MIVLIVGGGLYWLMRANQPRELTQEEYEERLRESIGKGLLSGGAMGLQKILDPAAEKAVAVQNDLRAGHYHDQQESGDGDDKNDVGKDGAGTNDEGIKDEVNKVEP